MAYSSIPSKSNGSNVTAAEWNQYVVDNFAASVPDILQAADDLAVASGSQAAGRLPVGDPGTFLRADSGETLGVAWEAIPRATVRNTASQSLYPAVTTAVDFNLTDESQGGVLVDLVNNRLYMPEAGVYTVTYSVEIARGVPYGTNDFPTLGYYIALYLSGAYGTLLDIWTRDNTPPAWNSLQWSGSITYSYAQNGIVGLSMFLNRSGYLGPVTISNARLSVELVQ